MLTYWPHLWCIRLHLVSLHDFNANCLTCRRRIEQTETQNKTRYKTVRKTRTFPCRMATAWNAGREQLGAAALSLSSLFGDHFFINLVSQFLGSMITRTYMNSDLRRMKTPEIMKIPRPPSKNKWRRRLWESVHSMWFDSGFCTQLSEIACFYQQKLQ